MFRRNISGPYYGGFKLFAGPQFGDLCGRTWDASNESKRPRQVQIPQRPGQAFLPSIPSKH